MPKVSIIMPSLNVAPYIEECMQSVVSQTMQDIEIICVDAGSDDGTLEILQYYQEKDPRVNVVLSERKSYGYQMNLGISRASGEYIGIVETDDYIAHDMYESLYAIAHAHDLDIVKGDFTRFSAQGEERSFQLERIVSDSRLYNRVLMPTRHRSVFHTFGFTWAGIYKKTFLTDHAILHRESPGASHQDNGFFVQTYAHANRVYFVPRAYYFLRRDNPNSSIMGKRGMMMLEEYAFLTSRLQEHPDVYARIRYLLPLIKLKNYVFALDHTPLDQRRFFVERMREEFLKMRDSGDLKKKIFGKKWNNVIQLMDAPDDFYLVCCFPAIVASAVPEDARKAFQEQFNRYVRMEQNSIRRTTDFRLGSALLYPYRALKRLIRR